jgi:hypothetical protein
MHCRLYSEGENPEELRLMQDACTPYLLQQNVFRMEISCRLA